AFANREDGKPAGVAAVQLSPGANAVRTAAAIQARMEELRPSLPQGMQFSLPYNTAPFVKISIQKVVQTLIEAMVLVFLVMYLFL
ncbi:efflux RND transporter permease subunit, partial [Acinetobacter baumannii]